MTLRTATRSVTLGAWRRGSTSGDMSGVVTARRNAKCEFRAKMNLWVVLGGRSGRGRASHGQEGLSPFGARSKATRGTGKPTFIGYREHFLSKTHTVRSGIISA